VSFPQGETPPTPAEAGVPKSDREQFAEWATDTEPLIRELCVWHLSGLKDEDAEEPEDIAQKVLARCWTQIWMDPTEGWRLLATPGWIKTVTTNACTDFWRKPARKRELNFDLSSDQFEADDDPQQDRDRGSRLRELPRQQDQLFSATSDPRGGGRFDHVLDPEIQFFNREWSTELKAELRKLPPNQRRALALYYFGGASQQRIAAILGLSEGTVNSHLTRGLKNLHKKFASQSREVEAHLWRLERSFRGRWMVRLCKPPAVLAPPSTKRTAGFCSRSRQFHHLRLFQDSGSVHPGLECVFDCASCNLWEQSKSAGARASCDGGITLTAPKRILSPGWASAPTADDPEDIALMQKIHSTLALVRGWFPRLHYYPLESHIQEEQKDREKREKRVLDLKARLRWISAEMLNVKRVSACCTLEERAEWNEWKHVLEQGRKELRRERKRIRAPFLDEWRAWWVEKELRDVAYFLNTDNVPPRFGNRWHFTGVKLFMQRNATMAERHGVC